MDCRVEEEEEVEEKKKAVQSDAVTRARCCSCSTFPFLCRANTLIQTIWREKKKNFVQVPNVALACFVTICLALCCQN